MPKIGLISDTHSFYDPSIKKYFAEVDEIWHAGDIGQLSVCEALEKIAPLRAVYGNIDDHQCRMVYPKDQIFEIEQVKVWMTHIGGYPPRYTKKISEQLNTIQPQIFICGHSHILKAIQDPKRKILHLNPGAAGHHGFHKMRTLMRFEISEGRPKNLEVIELGKRGQN